MPQNFSATPRDVLNIFTRNNLLPKFNDYSTTQLYKKIFVDKITDDKFRFVNQLAELDRKIAAAKQLAEEEAQRKKLEASKPKLTANFDYRPLIKKYDNLIVVRTFSKSRSFAGGRAGYCLGSPEIIKDIEFMRFSTNPFNLSRMACAAAEASFDDDEYFRSRVADVVKVRDGFSEALRKLGFEVTESSSNFVFARFPGKNGRDLAAALRERGILIRRFDSERIKDHLRITVGTAEQMSALVDALSDILKG